MWGPPEARGPGARAPMAPLLIRHCRGVLGGHNPKVLGGCQTTGPIGTKFGIRLRIRLGMDIV